MAILHIDILGSKFSIQANEDEEYLNNLKNYYSRICKEIETSDGLTDPKQIAVLAGILITDELFKARTSAKRLEASIKETKPDSGEDEKITKALIDKIDQALS